MKITEYNLVQDVSPPFHRYTLEHGEHRIADIIKIY